MSFKLRRLEFRPRAGGWTSGSLRFGEPFTLIHGPNGSGKTPLIKGIIFALGCPVEMPLEISSRCSGVELDIEADDGLWRIERPFADKFSVRIFQNEGDAAQVIESEKDYSEWLLAKMGMKPSTLVSKQNAKANVYIGTVIPGLWVDQDRGWTSIYAAMPTQNFIVSQQQEMIRLLLGLRAKRPFDQREEYEGKKGELATLDERLSFRRIALERERRQSDPGRPIDELRSLRDTIARDLDNLSESLGAANATADRFEGQIRKQRAVCDDVRLQRDVLDRQSRRLESIQQELDAEIEILNSNGVAADVFQAFCAKPDCALFKNAEKSYGHRLLYLKDQIKDLKLSEEGIDGELAKVQSALSQEEAGLARIVEDRDRTLEAAGMGKTASEVKSLSQRLAAVETAIARLEHFNSEFQKLKEMIEERARLEAQVKALKPGKNADDLRTKEVRAALAKNLAPWIDCLKTPNVGGAVEINDELEPVLGGQRFHPGSSHSGSTRTRVVLAYRAALLQTAVEEAGAHPGLMIYDAPQQQEIEEADLKDYFSRLREFCAKHSARTQIVVAFSGTMMAQETGDAWWAPNYQVAGKPHFLGTPS